MGKPLPTFEEYAPIVNPAAQRKADKEDAGIAGTKASTALAGERAEDIRDKRAEREAKLAKEEQGKNDRALKAAGYYRNDIQIALQNLDKIRSLVGPYTTGAGVLLKDIPASKAKELAAALKQLKNNEFLMSVARLKDEGDGKGTGIGRILQSEVPILQERYGSLDQARNGKDLLETISVMENTLRSSYARINGDGALLDSSDPMIAATARARYGVSLPGNPSGPAVLGPSAPNDKLMAPDSATKSVPIPAQMQQEYEDYVSGQFDKGGLDPKGYATFRASQNDKYGFKGTSPADLAKYEEEAANLNVAVRRGYNVNLRIPPPQLPPSESERALARIAANPIGGPLLTLAGSGMSGFTDDVAPWLTSKVTGKDERDLRYKQQLLEEQNPLSAAAGRFAGAGLQYAAAPELAVAGGLPLQVAHGALSGAMSSPDDRLAGAAWGGGTALGFGVAGKTLAPVIAGGGRAVSALATKYKLPLTPGVLTQSPWGRWLEERAAQIPGVGTGVAKRLDEANYAFNQAAFDDALKTVPGSTNGAVGHEGYSLAKEAVDNAYDDALGGVVVPNTAAFRKTADEAIAAITKVNADAGKLLNKEWRPFLDKDVLTGEDLQQIRIRGANVGAIMREKNGAEWSNYARPALGTVDKAFEDMLEGAGESEVAKGLRDANTAYRKLGIIGDAVNAHGTEGGIFTPDTLYNTAAKNVEAFEGPAALARGTTRKGGSLPLINLARAAADKNTGLLKPSGNTMLPLAGATGLGLVEGVVEGALNSDDKHPSTDNISSKVARNMALVAAPALALRGVYSPRMQQLLRGAIARPTNERADLWLRYIAPRGVTAASNAAGYTSGPAEQEYVPRVVAQLPPVNTDPKKLWQILPPDAPTPAPSEGVDPEALDYKLLTEEQ